MATADPDSQFVEWTGDCNGANCNLTMNQSHSVGAVFELYPDLRVVINDDRVSLPGNGGTVTIVVTVSSVGLVDPSGNATITSLPMTNVTNVTWTCAATDTVCENANGVGVLDESVAMPSGSQLVFTFTGTAPTPALGEVATSATVVNPDPELPPNQADNTDTGTFFYHQIFRDGFESGNHGAWSTHFPLP
jgi:hypothetical protein